MGLLVGALVAIVAVGAPAAHGDSSQPQQASPAAPREPEGADAIFIAPNAAEALPGPELLRVLGDATATDDQLRVLEAWLQGSMVTGPDGTDAGDGLDGISRAQLEDWMQVSRQTGTSVTEVLAEFGHQDRYRELTTWLNERYPDAFAGSIVRGDDGVPTIRFAGPLPDDAKDAIAETPRGAWVETTTVSLRTAEGYLVSAQDLISGLDATTTLHWDADTESVVVHIGDRTMIEEAHNLLDAAGFATRVEHSTELDLEPEAYLDDNDRPRWSTP